MTTESEFDSIKLCSDNNTNNLVIRCRRCNERILSSGNGTYQQEEKTLPTAKDSDDHLEKLQHWWIVSSMWNFDNIAFCKTANGIKYIACAECEHEPIGFTRVDDPSKIFLCHHRVKYE